MKNERSSEMKELKRLSEQMSDVKASVTMTMTATEELIQNQRFRS